MQQGPTGGLAGVVPRTVNSHILRNLLPSAEILMALGRVCVCMCMCVHIRERGNIFPHHSSVFHIYYCKYPLFPVCTHERWFW